MGITSGIILGTTVPGYLSHHFGWQTAFISAGIGLIYLFLFFLMAYIVLK